MSGMAGNVTAFNTVWTLISTSLTSGQGGRCALLNDGKMATVFGIALSVAARNLATVSQHHGHAGSSSFAFVKRALVCDVFCWRSVLETRDRAWRFQRVASGNLLRRGDSTTD